jgi:hypothetical protein
VRHGLAESSTVLIDKARHLAQIRDAPEETRRSGTDMNGRMASIGSLTLVCALLAGFAAAQTPPSPTRVTELINTIKTSKILGDRYIAAQELPNVVSQLPPASVNDAMVNTLTALLSSEEIFVVHYAALSLGSLGPRAARAIPQLQAAMGKVRELRARAGYQVNPQGAEEGLCFALERMMVNAPDCENGQYRY